MAVKVKVEFILDVNGQDRKDENDTPVLVLESSMKAESMTFMMQPYHKTFWSVVLEEFVPRTIIPYRYIMMPESVAAKCCTNHELYDDFQRASLEDIRNSDVERCRRHVEIHWVDCQVIDTWGDPVGQRLYNDSEVTFVTHYQTTPGFELAVVGLGPVPEKPQKATYTEGSFWRFTTRLDRYERDWKWHWEVLCNDGFFRREENVGDGRPLLRLHDSLSQEFKFDWNQVVPKEEPVTTITRNRYGVRYSEELYRCRGCNKEVDCPSENIVSDDPCVCPDDAIVTQPADNVPSPPPQGPGGSGPGGSGPGDSGSGGPGDEDTRSASSPSSGDMGQEHSPPAPQDDPSVKDGSEAREGTETEQGPVSDDNTAPEDSVSPAVAAGENEGLQEVGDDIAPVQGATPAAVEEALVEEGTDQRQEAAPPVAVEETPCSQAALEEQGARGQLPADSDQPSHVPAPVSWYVTLSSVTLVPTLQECSPRELSLAAHTDTGKDSRHPKLSCIEETEEHGFMDIALDGMEMDDEEVELLKTELQRDFAAEAVDEHVADSRSPSATSHITSSTDALSSEFDSSDTLQDIIEGILAECESDSESLPEMYTLTTIAESNETTEETATQAVGFDSIAVGPTELQDASTTLTFNTDHQNAENVEIQSPRLTLPIQEVNCHPLDSAIDTVSPEQKMISEIRHQLQRLKVAEKASNDELRDANVSAQTMREIQDRHAFSPETSSKATAKIVEKYEDAEEDGVERPPSPVAEPLEKEEETEVEEYGAHKEDSAKELHEPMETNVHEDKKSETTEAAELNKSDEEDKETSDGDTKGNKSGEGEGGKGKGHQTGNKPSAADAEATTRAKADTPLPSPRPGSGGHPNSQAALVKQRLFLLSRDVLPNKTDSPARKSSAGEKGEAKGQGKGKKQGKGEKPEAVNIVLQEVERTSGSPELKRARFSQNQNRRGSRSTSNLLHSSNGGGDTQQRQQGGQGREEDHLTITPGTKRRHDSRGNLGRSDQERGGGSGPGSGSNRREGRNRRNSDSDQRSWSRSQNPGQRGDGRFGPHFSGGQGGDEKFGRPGGPEGRREDEHMGGRGGRGGPGGRRGRDRDRDMFFDSPRSYGGRPEGHFQWQPHDRPGERPVIHGGERGMHLEEGVGPFDRPRPGQPRFGWPQLGVQGSRGPSEWPQPAMLPSRPNRRGLPPLKPVPPLPMDPRCDPLRAYPNLRNDIR